MKKSKEEKEKKGRQSLQKAVCKEVGILLQHRVSGGEAAEARLQREPGWPVLWQHEFHPRGSRAYKSRERTQLDTYFF